MSAGAFFKRKSEVGYLVSRLLSHQECFVTDKVLTELVMARAFLEREEEHIAREEYHKIRVDTKELRTEAKNAKEYKDIKKKKPTPGLEVEQVRQGNVCPITQREIESRVEAPCGHVFDREGVRFLYDKAKGSKAVKCPHVGCEKSWKQAGFPDL